MSCSIHISVIFDIVVNMDSEVKILSLPLTSFVILGKSLKFFELLWGSGRAGESNEGEMGITVI